MGSYGYFVSGLNEIKAQKFVSQQMPSIFVIQILISIYAKYVILSLILYQVSLHIDSWI